MVKSSWLIPDSFPWGQIKWAAYFNQINWKSLTKMEKDPAGVCFIYFGDFVVLCVYIYIFFITNSTSLLVISMFRWVRSYTVGGNVNWCRHYGKWYGSSLKKLKIELPYDPAIQFLGIYTENTKALLQKDTCIPMFIAALFSITKTWKQSKCPSTDDWLKKIWYVYNGILLSHKEEWNIAICSNMDGPREYYTYWSKLDREDKYYMTSLICGT